MNGRVCRLLITPMLRALKKVCGTTEYLEYMDSFKYALSGEFAFQKDQKEIAIGDKIDVFLEKIENHNGECILSRSKAKSKEI